jgi:hypothetical protein
LRGDRGEDDVEEIQYWSGELVVYLGIVRRN